jgi:AcrR family transcriptional regulator
VEQDSRKRILEAAKQLVNNQGYERTSLRAIAREAGFSPASLYEYFSGRDAVLDALADEVREALAKHMKRGMKKHPPHSALVFLALAYIDFAQRWPADFELLFQHSQSRKLSLREPPTGPFALVVAQVEAAMAEGFFAGKEPQVIALGLWAFAHGLATLRIGHLAAFEVEYMAMAADLIETHLRGWQI